MKIVQLTNSTPTQMMGFVIQAVSGEVLVIDGGNTGDADELCRVIRSFGGHADLWLITHPHCDHHDAVISLLSDPRGVTFDRLGSSRLSNEWAAATRTRDAKNLFDWNAFQPSLGEKWFELQAGQTFRLGSMTVEVLAGANPDLTVNPFNNQSCVFRVTENGFVFLVLGDLGVEAGNRLLANHPHLTADALQAAHHGQQGVDEAFYRAVRPRIVFWATPDWLWTNQDGKGPFKTLETRAWMEKLGVRNITAFDHTVLFDTKDETVMEY